MFTCREPLAAFLLPAIVIAAGIAASSRQPWMWLPLAAFLGLGWSLTPQRLDVTASTLTASYLPFRQWSVTVPLSEARVTYDRFHLRIERLDGCNVAPYRKTIEVRLIADFAGPPALVTELRSHGLYVHSRNGSAASG